MKKICFFIGNLNLTGGTERVTTVLANILVEQGYDVTILSISEGLSPSFDVSPDIQLFQLFNTPVSMKLKFFSSINRIRRFVIENEIETFIVVDSISCIFTAPALFGLDVNHICWEHFNFKFNFGSKFRDLGRKIATLRCNYIVTLTKNDAEQWHCYYKKTKANIITIYNPSPYQVQEVTPIKDTKIVVCVGRLSYEKGVDLLLDAWARVILNKSDWCLKIIGHGAELDNLKQKSIDLKIQNSVYFEGEVSDVTTYYRDANFLCLPSRNEGFGMVIIEANSFGLPVLAFDIETGPRELIVEGTGHRVKPYDIEEFSKNILKMMNMTNSEYKQYSIECKKNMLNFSKETILSHWKDVL